jgi:hypothetical protein
LGRKSRAGSSPASSTKNLKTIYLYQMKKVLFIAALVTLASCSNETTTSSTDSTCVDSLNTDSLIQSTEAHADSLHTEIMELKK